jgi:hypothetical protein
VLAGLAAAGVAADEEVGAGGGEAEDGVAALEAEEGGGGVAGVVMALAHHQHRVAVAVIPKHCAAGPSHARTGKIESATSRTMHWITPPAGVGRKVTCTYRGCR